MATNIYVVNPSHDKIVYLSTFDVTISPRTYVLLTGKASIETIIGDQELSTSLLAGEILIQVSENGGAYTKYPGGTWVSTVTELVSYLDADERATLSAGGASYETVRIGAGGTLSVFTSTRRYYPSYGIKLVDALASVGTAPVGSNLIITLYKNAGSIGTITISDGSTTSSLTNFSTTFTDTDYLTYAITQVGSSVPGADLDIRIRANLYGE